MDVFQYNRFFRLSILLLFLIVSACKSSRYANSFNDNLPGNNDSVNGNFEKIIKDTVSNSSNNVNFLPKRNTYNIGLFLPFVIDRSRLASDFPESYISGYHPFVILEFYEGILTALDTLKKQNLDINLHVYDTEKDTQTVQNILNGSEFSNVDVIIGPITKECSDIIARFSEKKNVYWFSPLATVKPGIFPDKKHFSFLTNEMYLANQTVDHILTTFKRPNIIIIHKNTEEEKIIADRYKELFSNHSQSTPHHKVLSISTDFYLSGLDNKLSVTDTNIIIVPSEDEIFVSALLRRLNQFALKTSNKEFVPGKSIILFGKKSWLDWEAISMEYLHNLRFHFITDYWIDSDSDFAERFQSLFKAKYGSDVSDYVYKGYDLMMYIGSLLKNYDVKWAVSSINDYNVPDNKLNFHFHSIENESNGKTYFENRKSFIICYNDYRFWKIK